MGQHCPASITRIPRRIQAECSCPGRGRAKAITWRQDGYCSGNLAFPLHLVPRKAHSGLYPNPQAGTQVAMMSLPTWELIMKARAPGLKDRENSGHFHPYLDNRASRPFHSHLGCLHVNKKWHPLTGEESEAFAKQISTIAREQRTWA